MVENGDGQQGVRKSLGWKEGICSCHGLFREFLKEDKPLKQDCCGREGSLPAVEGV